MVQFKKERYTVYDRQAKNLQKLNLEDDFLFSRVMSDSEIISHGEICTKLKKSYIIFICTFDPFSGGRHIYTFQNRCLEDFVTDVRR